MHCSHCGNKLPERAIFCNSCGKNLIAKEINKEYFLPILRKLKNFKLGTKIAYILIGVLVASIITTIYFVSLNNSLKNDIAATRLNNEQLSNENELLNKEKSQAIDAKNASDLGYEFVSSYATYIGNKYDELHDILLRSDTNSVDTINWFYQNAQFDNETMPYAYGKYTAWKATEDEIVNDYTKLIQDMKSKLDELNSLIPDNSSNSEIVN